MGHSVFHCPFCHGWEVRDRPLGVLDGGDRAAERALLLTFWSDEVTLYTSGVELDGPVRARLARAGVEVDDRVVTELRGPDRELRAIAFADGTERACAALLVPAPLRQRSSLTAQLGVEVADPGAFPDGAFAVDPLFRTSIPHVYAAGDVGAHVLPSVATAIANGSAAAKTIVHDLVASAYPSETASSG